MEKWERTHRRGRETANPSFSSSLLDAIYRSIDEGDDIGTCGKDAVRAQRQQKGEEEEAERGPPTHHSHRRSQYQAVTTTTTEKRYTATVTERNRKKSTATVTEKVVVRHRGYGADVPREYQRHAYSRQAHQQRERHLLNSASSSSDSSYGGFSSSEAESVLLYGRPKPFEFEMTAPPLPRHERPLPCLETKKGGSIKSRIRASKIYSELKKAKSPVSPGGRLAAFLNSLFTSAGHPKKPKTASAVKIPPATAGDDTSACSSASSFSRSCLSKTPSSRGKPANGAKRSVRFYPVSIIVDEDLRLCGQKSLYEEHGYGGGVNLTGPLPSLTAIRVRDPSAVARAVEETKRAAARDLIRRRYSGTGMQDVEDEEEEENEDDAASCSSSDLFELENFTAIGGGETYGDELPVYETTHLQTNRSIARGLLSSRN